MVKKDGKGQTETVREIFPKSKYVNVISLNKNKPYAHGYCPTSHYIAGGGQLIFINPTFKMNIFWFRQKSITYVKNKIRIFKSA